MAILVSIFCEIVYTKVSWNFNLWLQKLYW